MLHKMCILTVKVGAWYFPNDNGENKDVGWYGLPESLRKVINADFNMLIPRKQSVRMKWSSPREVFDSATYGMEILSTKFDSNTQILEAEVALNYDFSLEEFLDILEENAADTWMEGNVDFDFDDGSYVPEFKFISLDYCN